MQVGQKTSPFYYWEFIADDRATQSCKKLLLKELMIKQ